MRWLVSIVFVNNMFNRFFYDITNWPPGLTFATSWSGHVHAFSFPEESCCSKVAGVPSPADSMGHSFSRVEVKTGCRLWRASLSRVHMNAMVFKRCGARASLLTKPFNQHLELCAQALLHSHHLSKGPRSLTQLAHDATRVCRQACNPGWTATTAESNLHPAAHLHS